MGTGIVAINVIIIINMALHFIVIIKASLTPSYETPHFHMWNIISPFPEKGTNNHKNPINRLAKSRVLATFFRDKEEIRIKNTDIKKAIKDTSTLLRKAIAKAVVNPDNILILGSEQCIKEFPS